MTRLLGIDFETTGRSPEKDLPIEVGLSLWEFDGSTPHPILSEGIYIYDKTYPSLSAEIVELTGISPQTLIEFGLLPSAVATHVNLFCERHMVSYLVAHNAEAFDRIIYKRLCGLIQGSTNSLDLPWIDTMYDLPFAKEPDSKKLKHLALDHNVPVIGCHRAMFDALMMMQIVTKYKLEDIISYRDIPTIVIRALVDYDNRQAAKDMKFSWEKLGDKLYAKSWVKRIKANKLKDEQKRCNFKIAQIG